jgi:methylmalonyl-CoA mutase N-terminal domain/subunit
MRFHTQTAGVSLTAQQPEVNIVRTAIEALAGVLGGTQSLHTNSYDEAIGLPSQKAATLALRTQQVIAYESDLTATVDPFAGSYAVESMTDDIVAAIEQGFQKAEIERSAYQVARQIESGERVVVGVNRFQADTEEPQQPLQVDLAIEREQAKLLAELRSSRNAAEHKRRLDDLRRAAEGTENVLVPLREALRAQATVGEVCDTLREVWGVYLPPDAD